ncbi:MAG: 4Fe-4S binding protein [Candidatus Bathyarchaeota archaeon]
MNKQKIRSILMVVMFALFPIIYYFFSPYLVIMGASEGIISGSLIVFASLFISSLFLGRAFCGWICPAGATQELCMKIRNKPIANGKKNYIKYTIWVPWISIIILMFIQAGGILVIDPLYQTYYGISITNMESLILFAIISGGIAAIALVAGKRAACHTICWMAPFMIIGRKIRNATNLPALQLKPQAEKCINCKICTKKMENTECILCGSCVDNCPKGAIQYSFGQQK